jgi:alkylation response protein AidB-like acyl-CoA dehydrogenase
MLPLSLMTRQEQYPSHYHVAEALEQRLGDPWNPVNAFSYRSALELDERDEYPEEACALLEQWGLHHYYVPVEDGGKLASLEELLELLRVVARRDFTVAVAHFKTYLGATSVWVAGHDQQRAGLAKIIKNRGQVALGLTEKDHGSDLLATQTKAKQTARGYLLAGDKWLINNATRGAALTVFARTDTKGGPRGFSLFLVEKKALDEASYSHLPKILTHGIRGADISGIRFADCLIPPDSMIGAPGSGLETTLKAFQVTRTIIVGLSLGAADTALRATLRFALARRLYAETVFAIPHARRVLSDAFLDLLVCDCLAIAGARALHVATDQMSVWSAVVKYLVPTMIENVFGNLSGVLGARYYLREGHEWAIFQKMLRDNAITSLFDGSTVVNLNMIAQQLRQLAQHRAKKRERHDAELGSRLESIFSLKKPLPPFEPKNLELFNRGRDDALNGMETALAHLHALKTDVDVERAALERITTLAGEVLEEVKSLDQSLSKMESGRGGAFNQSPAIFELAKRYAILFAAATCLLMWIHNRRSAEDFLAEGAWLVLCLRRLLGNLRPARESLPDAYYESVAQRLVMLERENKLFSIVPLQLASNAGGPETPVNLKQT